MNVDKLDGNWNNTSQKPEDDATIFVAVKVSARFGGGYRVEAAVYDAENDCITLLSSYKGGEDFDIWNFWKYADENTMTGRFRTLFAAIDEYKEEISKTPPFSWLINLNNNFLSYAKKIGKCGVSSEQLICSMDKMNQAARTVGPYSKEELQAREKNGIIKKIWKSLNLLKN